MKFGFFDNWTLGVVRGDRIVDVSDVVGNVRTDSPMELATAVLSNLDVLRGPMEERAASNEGVPLRTVTVLPPVPRPDKIICMAVNYLEGENPPIPEIDAFLKASDCVIGHGGTVLMDPKCNARIFHAEPEVALVIGKQGRHIEQPDAMEHVLGYTGFFDVSGRIQVRGAQSYFQSKSWATFGPMGPFIVTKDEFPDPHNINVRVWNGDYNFPGYNTGEMAHKIPECIEFASAVMELNVGDIISTGTNHQNLGAIQDGDRIGMDIEGIGALEVLVSDPARREWARGRDEEMAARMRAGERN